MSIQLAPELESQLQDISTRQGTTPDEIIARLLAEWLEDQSDITIAEQVLATTDEANWHTLDELRAAIRGRGE